MRLLKQSTAYNWLVFMTDSADHVTGKTGLTLTITLSKDGGAFSSISPTVTERSNGWYNVALTTSHTDTVGDIAMHITGTGCDPSDVVGQVRANVLGDTLPAAVQSIASNAINAAAIASDAITSSKIADGAITAAKFAANALDAVWSTSSRTLTAATNITAAIAAAVWSESVRVLTAATNLNIPSAATIAAAVWDYLASAASTVGSLGKLLVDNINATISSRSSHAATDIVSNGAITTSGGAVSTVTTTTNVTNAPTSGDLTATMKASVNAEVVDALNVDTYAEPGQGTPAATLSLAAKINYLFKSWRNKKTQTSSVWSLFNDDASTVDQKATVSDDATTATKGEISTGP